MIKRNSANLFSFLSLLDNLFICSHLTRCRQTYFPMDRANLSFQGAQVHLDLLSQSISNSDCKGPQIFWGKQRQLQHSQMQIQKMSVLIATHIFSLPGSFCGHGHTGNICKNSPSMEVCSFTETQLTGTSILQFEPSVDKLRTENIFYSSVVI